jgi:hypothetical protein
MMVYTTQLKCLMRILSIKLDENTLPPVFLGAVFASRRLDIDQLWIDALCIVQDDPTDWAAEASRMGSFSQHAYCNFGASAAAKCTARADATLESSFGTQENNAIPGIFTARDVSAFSMAQVTITRGNYGGAYHGFNIDQYPNLHSSELIERGWVRSL